MSVEPSPDASADVANELKRGLDRLRAAASRGPVSTREIFSLTDPLMDTLSRAPADPRRPLDERVQRMAATGTAAAFLKTSDPHKREFFALAVETSAKLNEARALLAMLVDEGPCRLDHNGNCQAHAVFGLAGDLCPHEEAKRFIAPSEMA